MSLVIIPERVEALDKMELYCVNCGTLSSAADRDYTVATRGGYLPLCSDKCSFEMGVRMAFQMEGKDSSRAAFKASGITLASITN